MDEDHDIDDLVRARLEEFKQFKSSFRPTPEQLREFELRVRAGMNRLRQLWLEQVKNEAAANLSELEHDLSFDLIEDIRSKIMEYVVGPSE